MGVDSDLVPYLLAGIELSYFHMHLDLRRHYRQIEMSRNGRISSYHREDYRQLRELSSAGASEQVWCGVQIWLHLRERYCLWV
jgi:hypothetical protein